MAVTVRGLRRTVSDVCSFQMSNRHNVHNVYLLFKRQETVVKLVVSIEVVEEVPVDTLRNMSVAKSSCSDGIRKLA